VSAAHQSLHHFVAKADWSDQALLAAVRAGVLPSIERHGPIAAWIIDDTGFPKKAKDLALSLPASVWQDVIFRDLGSRPWARRHQEDLVSHFAAQSIRPAHRDYEREQPWPELWPLIERPEDEDEPTKFRLADLPADTPIDHPVRRSPCPASQATPADRARRSRTQAGQTLSRVAWARSL
jgi:SRSO17 transposase